MMPVTLAIVVESLFLGVALAMDAMAVTLSNTLCEPDMPAGKKLAMPLLFAIFQMAMPTRVFSVERSSRRSSRRTQVSYRS